MKKYLLLLLTALVLVSAGCCSHSGSREFFPGQGWKYTD